MVAWWNLALPHLVFSPEAPIHAPIEVLAQFNSDARRLVLDQTLVECQSARDALAGDGCGVRDVGGGGPPAAARRPAVIIAAG